MRKEQLKEAVGELNLVDTVFEADGVSYIDTAVSVMQVYDLIDQLDEPEVLSQEWIDENKFEVNGWNEAVHVEDLQNLIVPKQELPVIPKYVGEYLEFTKSYASLKEVMEVARRRNELPKWEKEYNWISANDEFFARAWLDGYEVEEEPKYNVQIKPKSSSGAIGLFLFKLEDEVLAGDNFKAYYPEEDKFRLTEQEIKDYDPRYWAFAKPVEEME